MIASKDDRSKQDNACDEKIPIDLANFRLLAEGKTLSRLLPGPLAYVPFPTGGLYDRMAYRRCWRSPTLPGIERL